MATRDFLSLQSGVTSRVRCDRSSLPQSRASQQQQKQAVGILRRSSIGKARQEEEQEEGTGERRGGGNVSSPPLFPAQPRRLGACPRVVGFVPAADEGLPLPSLPLPSCSLIPHLWPRFAPPLRHRWPITAVRAAPRLRLRLRRRL